MCTQARSGPVSLFGFGLAGPTHRFLGISPELISL
jgi:hypothetical protein